MSTTATVTRKDRRRIEGALRSIDTAHVLRRAAQILASDDEVGRNEVVRDEIRRLELLADEYDEDAMESVEPDELEAWEAGRVR